jgi:hypothetical protein
MKDRERIFASRNSAYALGWLGGDALPPLMAVFTNQAISGFDRCTAGRSLTSQVSLRTNAGPWVPMVAQCLQEKDSVGVAEMAAFVLGAWGLEPRVAVPALAQNVQDVNHKSGQAAALQSLGQFGEAARSAVPQIIGAFSDPDAAVREGATNALYRIAPEMFQGGAETNGNFRHED